MAREIMSRKETIKVYVISGYDSFWNNKDDNSEKRTKQDDFVHGACMQGYRGFFDNAIRKYDNNTQPDIVFLTARSELPSCLKKIIKLGFLNKTVLVLDESGAVDWKCGTFFLKHFSRTFPGFLTYRDDFVDDQVFFSVRPIGAPIYFVEKSNIDDEHKRKICMVCANKKSHLPHEMYSLRRKCIEYFEANPEIEFDLYGPLWGPRYKNWKGIIKNKKEIYHSHKYALCIENSHESGYITEKIYDCFRYGIVPIYAGPPNVDRYIPRDCYIDFYSFTDLNEMVDYLYNLSDYDYGQLLKGADKYINSKDYSNILDTNNCIVDLCYKEIMKNEFKPSIIQLQILKLIEKTNKMYCTLIRNIANIFA